MVHNYCSSHFHPKTISKQESISEQISRYMFLITFSGPIMVEMAKKHCFHPKTIPKQGSYAYISPNLKKYVFGPQKRIFDTFAHIFGPEKGQNSFSVIFIQKTFPKKVTFLCFTVKVLGPKKGLLAHVLGEIGQIGPKLFFS